MLYRIYFLLIVFIFPTGFATIATAERIHKFVYENDIENTKAILDTDRSQVNKKDSYGILLNYPKLFSYKRILQFDFSKSRIIPSDAPNTAGWNPLMMAVANDNLDMVKLILSYSPKINQGDKTKTTAIHIASIIGNIDIVQLLLSKKASLSSKNIYGFSPVLLASAMGNLEVLKYLISKGANLNSPDYNGITPLMYASLLGKIPLVESIVNSGGDIESKDKNNNTAIMYAAFHGNVGLIAYLVGIGAEVDNQNNQGLTPVLYAAISKQLRSVKFLLEHGASANQKLKKDVILTRKTNLYPAGSSLMDIATINDDQDMIDYLESATSFSNTEDHEFSY